LREMSVSALAWTAGLVEGEGTFTNSTSSSVLRVVMTDLDVLERLEQITGVGYVRSIPSRQSHHKQAYSWTVKRREHLEPLAKLLWPLMGERRRRQMESCKTLMQITWPDVSVPAAELIGPAAAWVAGVLEGEGCFRLTRRHGGRINLESTDADIVERVQALTGGDLYRQAARKESWKPTTILAIRGRTNLRRVLPPILPWLLQRRAKPAWMIYEWSKSSGWPFEGGDPGCRTR
jgi:LAGLIDADG-like domain